MIIRILGEGQYDVADHALDRLNELDATLEAAVEIDVKKDGTATVKWPPLRPSGIDEFDRNCAEAIRRAAPFDPIPVELGVSRLRIRAPFVASNPIVK